MEANEISSVPERAGVQAIRVLDVAVIGPLMIYGAVKAKSLHPVPRVLLGVFGVTTIVYNAMGWLRAERSNPVR